jgi:hypothetical protein
MSSDHIPIAKTKNHWENYSSACRKCDTYIVVYVHPKEEPYRLWVCHKCAAQTWFSHCIQRGYH